MDREDLNAAVYGVTKSQIRLSDWTELNPDELNWTNRTNDSGWNNPDVQLLRLKTPKQPL